jgi:FkbM family methyltransferase
MTSMLQVMARGVSDSLGRDSLLIRTLRPIYESTLDWLGGGRGIEWEINGVLYRIDPHFRYLINHDHESAVASFLRSRVKPGDLCFDVGANVGIYALQFAHWSAPGGRVVAFEPNPEACAALTKHVRMNGLSGWVRVEPFAVGDQQADAMLYAAGADSRSRLAKPNELIADRSVCSIVSMISLSEFSRHNGLIPDWLLIDIEGLELAALRGATDLILERRHKLEIVVEMHPGFWAILGTSRAEAEGLLRELGLHAVPLTGQADPLGEYGLVHLAFE